MGRETHPMIQYSNHTLMRLNLDNASSRAIGGYEAIVARNASRKRMLQAFAYLTAIMFGATGVCVLMVPGATPRDQVVHAAAIPSYARVIDSSGNVGLFNSIAVDSENKAHVSYSSLDNGSLKYATNAKGVWETCFVDDETGMCTSIAVDSKDGIHISYSGPTGSTLEYATNKSGVWETTTVDSEFGHWFQNTSIAVDADINTYIAYFDFDSADLRYATNAAGAWATYIIDSVGWVGEDPSIEVDKDGIVHVAYGDESNGNLKYARNDGESWTISVVASSIGYHAIQDTSIAVDSNGKIHISYCDMAYCELKYATNTGGSWEVVTVDNSSRVGRFSSIALDSSDHVHISYFDCDNGNLKYATNASGGWANYTVEPLGPIWGHSSIAVDSYDRVHISCYDYADGELKYVTSAKPPTAVATVVPNPAMAYEYVSFDASGSSGDMPIVNWTWSFMDGGTPVVLYGEEVQHMFVTEPQTTTVVLTVRDVDGNTDTDTVVLDVVGVIPEFPGFAFLTLGIMLLLGGLARRRVWR